MSPLDFILYKTNAMGRSSILGFAGFRKLKLGEEPSWKHTKTSLRLKSRKCLNKEFKRMWKVSAQFIWFRGLYQKSTSCFLCLFASAMLKGFILATPNHPLTVLFQTNRLFIQWIICEWLGSNEHYWLFIPSTTLSHTHYVRCGRHIERAQTWEFCSRLNGAPPSQEMSMS